MCDKKKHHKSCLEEVSSDSSSHSGKKCNLLIENRKCNTPKISCKKKSKYIEIKPECSSETSSSSKEVCMKSKKVKCSTSKYDTYYVDCPIAFGSKTTFEDSVNIRCTLTTEEINSCNKLKICSFTKFVECVNFKNNCKFQGDVFLESNLKLCKESQLEINKITSCCCEPIYFDSSINIKGDIQICSGTLIISSIKANDETINLNGNLNVNGNLTANTFSNNTGVISFCNTTLQISQINPCDASGVTINNLVACTATIGTLNSCMGTFTFNDPIIVDGQVTATELSGCLGVTTNLLTSCSGNEITCESDFLIEENLSVKGSTVNFCPAILYVQTISSCGVNNISLIGTVSLTNLTSPTSNITLTSNIAMCGHSITLSELIGCNGELNVIGNVNIDTITTNSITACSNISTNTIDSCSGALNIIPDTLFQGDISSNQLTVTTITSNTGNVNFNSDVNISGMLTACNITTQVINSCGNNILFNSSISAPSIGSNNVNPLLITSNAQICGNNFIASNIVSCNASNISLLPGISTNSIVSSNYDLTNTNLGSGISILGSQSGPNGNTRTFKSLKSNTITITSTSDTVNLDISTLTTGQNIGSGTANIYDYTSGNVLYFRTLSNTDGNIIITQTPTEANINLSSNVVSGQNVGSGTGLLLSTVNNNTLYFNTLLSVSPELDITTSGNEVLFDISYLNNIASGTFDAPISVPPKTWTSYLTPTISGGVGNFSANSNGIQGTIPSFTVVFTMEYNMNDGNNSLSFIGATYVLLRFRNAGNIVSNYTQFVLSDPSVNDLFTNSFIVQYEFYDHNQANNGVIELWHNGTSNWTGATQVNFVINNT